jgi:2-oxoisovalerate dehydrogenase E1 component alpha subunit
MLRAARSLSTRLCAAAPMTNVELVNKAQSVWNIDFGGKPFTSTIEVQRKEAATPMYHVLDQTGEVVNTSVDVDALMPRALSERIMTTMVKQNQIDKILLESQRQGRISFYMTGFGEEAAVVGSAAALADDDYIFMQYREAAAMTYRGFTIREMVAQCMGNEEDIFKGRQMPIHYGSPRLHFQMVSSPLATQLPHAAGAGYAFRVEGKGRVCACYFGDGSASEGDFHAGLNFAATRGASTLYFVRNNGFAISTPTADQYKGDGILHRGSALGIPSIRVDGNDLLAVFEVTKRARDIIQTENTPALVEAMTYRVSHHSTSDDSTTYRKKGDIEYMAKAFDPIARFGAYLEKRGWWSQAMTEEIQKATRQEVLDELKRQEKLPTYPASTYCQDTTAVPLPRLVKQEKELLAHVARHPEFYDAEQH